MQRCITDCYYSLPTLCYTFQYGGENGPFLGDICQLFLKNLTMVKSWWFHPSFKVLPSAHFYLVNSISHDSRFPVCYHCLLHSLPCPCFLVSTIKLHTSFNAQLKHFLIHSSSLGPRWQRHFITSQLYAKAFSDSPLIANRKPGLVFKVAIVTICLVRASYVLDTLFFF